MELKDWGIFSGSNVLGITVRPSHEHGGFFRRFGGDVCVGRIATITGITIEEYPTDEDVKKLMAEHAKPDPERPGVYKMLNGATISIESDDPRDNWSTGNGDEIVEFAPNSTPIE